MKELVCIIFGTIGSFTVSLLGGWNAAMATLLIFMIIDYLTGLIVAGVFKKSLKTESGGLNSNIGFKGVCRKVMILLIVIVGKQLDLVLEIDYIGTAVIIAYIANETVSIIENAGLMGVPIPNIIKKAIDLLNKKAEVET